MLGKTVRINVRCLVGPSFISRTPGASWHALWDRQGNVILACVAVTNMMVGRVAVSSVAVANMMVGRVAVSSVAVANIMVGRVAVSSVAEASFFLFNDEFY